MKLQEYTVQAKAHRGNVMPGNLSDKTVIYRTIDVDSNISHIHHKMYAAYLNWTGKIQTGDMVGKQYIGRIFDYVIV